MLQLIPKNGTLATVGAGLLTAALLFGENVTRTGPTGNFADTFDTAANIAAALGPSGGANWYVTYVNNTAHIATLTAPAGGNFTLNGASAAIPANSVANLLISVTAGGAVTVTVLARYSAS